MYIKKIVEYVFNYAEYIVTDGKNDVRCICMSVPLPNGLEPKVGMEITKIYIFTINDLEIKLAKNKKEVIKHRLGLSYKIIGKVIARNIIECLGYKFTFYEDTIGFEIGDYVEVIADRLDCIVENHY